MQLNYRHKSVSPCRGSLLSRGRKMTKCPHDARGTYTQCFGRKAEKWWLRSRSSEDVSCRRELSKRLKNLLGTHLATPRHLAKAAHKRLREELLEENQLELQKDTPNCPFIQHSPSSYPWCLSVLSLSRQHQGCGASLDVYMLLTSYGSWQHTPRELILQIQDFPSSSCISLPVVGLG